MYNVREKVFTDGTVQATYYDKFRFKGRKGNTKKIGGPAEHGSGLSVERKEYENMKRARQIVWDLARSNVFDYWVTLTFSPEQVDDRYDFVCCAERVMTFTKFLGKHGCRWLLVPDTHEDGAYHFHGFLAGPLEYVRAVNPHTGQPLFDKQGRPCYNIPSYKLGFTLAVPLDGSVAVVGYLASYYTKNRKMIVPKGCKRYWASRNLARPEVRYSFEALMDFLRLRAVGAEYAKRIKSLFGSGYFYQTTEDQIYAQLEQLGRSLADLAPVEAEETWREV